MYANIAIIGSSGAIGTALTKILAESYPTARIHAFSRMQSSSLLANVAHQLIDYSDESSIAAAANLASEHQPLDLVLVATGILHDDSVTPEKSLRDLSAEKFQHVFAINTILPAIVAKHFLPKLAKDKKAVFAALSARVGSISDNHLGGWYSYRASKAALNMIIKTAAIEMGRLHKQAVVIGLHPGTVDSALSKPFQANVAKDKLFTPEHSARCLVNVLNQVSAADSGKCFAWDGQEILP